MRLDDLEAVLFLHFRLHFDQCTADVACRIHLFRVDSLSVLVTHELRELVVVCMHFILLRYEQVISDHACLTQIQCGFGKFSVILERALGVFLDNFDNAFREVRADVDQFLSSVSGKLVLEIPKLFLAVLSYPKVTVNFDIEKHASQIVEQIRTDSHITSFFHYCSPGMLSSGGMPSSNDTVTEDLDPPYFHVRMKILSKLTAKAEKSNIFSHLMTFL